MWTKWRKTFGWTTLCPIYFADPFGLVVAMPRARQPVRQDEIDALPDYYPTITAELKQDDYWWIGDSVLALDYGLLDRDMVKQQRQYYLTFAGKAAMELHE